MGKNPQIVNNKPPENRIFQAKVNQFPNIRLSVRRASLPTRRVFQHPLSSSKRADFDAVATGGGKINLVGRENFRNFAV